MSAATSVNGRASGPRLAIPDAPIADQDAERGFLGALLLHNDPKMTLRVAMKVSATPDSFYWESNGAIFAALYSLARQQIGGDAITVNAEMERAGTATDATREQLAALPSYVPAMGNYVEYGQIVVDLARWRKRRRVAYEMLEAIERRNEAEWAAAAAMFLPDPDPEEEDEPRGPSMLRLVDETGSVVGEKMHCESCTALEDQLAGASKEIAGWRTRYANLERDKDAAAAKDALWLPAQALFEYWKTQTSHKGSKWTPDRFWAVKPFLVKYGVETVARAIAGIAYDPNTQLRRNGYVERYDGWDTLTKSAGTIERYANRAPRDWKFTLNITMGSQEKETPRLALAQEVS